MTLLKYDIKKILKEKYSINNIIEITELNGGANRPKPLLIITKSKRKYKLTRLMGNKNDYVKIIKIINYLSENKLNIVSILRQIDEQQLIKIGSYNCILQNFIEGNIILRSKAKSWHFYEIGKFLGKAHDLLANLNTNRIFRSSREAINYRFNDFYILFDSLPIKIRKCVSKYSNFIQNQISLLQKNFNQDIYNKLPNQLCFYDLNIGNIVWNKKNKIIGVFDFDRITNLARIEDFRAPVLNNNPKRGFTYNYKFIKYLIKGYQVESKKILTNTEINLIKEVFRQAFLYLFYYYLKGKYFDLNNYKSYRLLKLFLKDFKKFNSDVNVCKFNYYNL